uniref:Uncharacterized protein n=1 Tax=Pseudomonas putida TaxID=303 RepID=A0A6C0L689_PSEPU|nr:hypothetical protein [Pseudomonas putida]
MSLILFASVKSGTLYFLNERATPLMKSTWPGVLLGSNVYRYIASPTSTPI